MSILLKADSELNGLKELISAILSKGSINGNYIELLSVLLSIEYNKENLTKFYSFLDIFLKTTDLIGEIGWRKATRVYTDKNDRRIKPSYLGRLTHYPDKPIKKNFSGESINQIDSIINNFIDKPGYSCLSLTFLRPADLIDKFRPGYVPCPIAGDFKFRNGKLDFSLMFRTNDALSVGYADIYYLRKLHERILNESKEKSENEKILNGNVGKLNLFFSRAFICKKIKRKAGGYLDGPQFAEKLLRQIDKYV